MGEIRLKSEGVEFRVYMSWTEDSPEEIRPSRDDQNGNWHKKYGRRIVVESQISGLRVCNGNV
jgi:hypothetical protein